MASKILLILFSFLFSLSAEAQYRDYYQEGNAFMNEKKFALAEQTFAEGIEVDSSLHILYPSLANAMTMQQKFNPADSVLDVILKKHPNYIGALWFKGLNYFYWDEDSMATVFFKKYLSIANTANNQIANAHYYIGRAYENLLRKEGLTQGDLTDLIVHYQKFITLAEGHPLVAKKKALIDEINAKKPHIFSGKWKLVADLKEED